MGAPKKATHVVVHPNLHLSVNGKLSHVARGTEVAMTTKQAERLRDKVQAIGEQKAVDLTPGDAE